MASRAAPSSVRPALTTVDWHCMHLRPKAWLAGKSISTMTGSPIESRSHAPASPATNTTMSPRLMFSVTPERGAPASRGELTRQDRLISSLGTRRLSMLMSQFTVWEGDHQDRNWVASVCLLRLSLQYIFRMSEIAAAVNMPRGASTSWPEVLSFLREFFENRQKNPGIMFQNRGILRPHGLESWPRRWSPCAGRGRVSMGSAP